MGDAIELRTAIDGLLLRSLTATPAELVAAFHGANAERILRHSPGSEAPPSGVRTVEATLAAQPPGQLMLGVWFRDVLVGVNYVVVSAETRSAGLGYGIDERYEGRGYSTAAVRAMTRYALDDLGVTTVTALTSVENVASRRVLEKAGFTVHAMSDGWVEYRFGSRA